MPRQGVDDIHGFAVMILRSLTRRNLRYPSSQSDFIVKRLHREATSSRSDFIAKRLHREATSTRGAFIANRYNSAIQPTVFTQKIERS